MANKSRIDLSDLIARVLFLLGFILSLLIIVDIYYSLLTDLHIFIVNLVIGLVLLVLVGRLALWFFRETTRPKMSDYKRLVIGMFSFFNTVYGETLRKR